MYEPCCEANEYGFPCLCVRVDYRYTEEYADTRREELRDEEMLMEQKDKEV